MKKGLVIGVFVCLFIAALVMSFSEKGGHDPKDLRHWVRLAGDKDWSSAAAQGDAEAQFYLGAVLLRTNLVISIDRVPPLSKLPIVGQRLFEKIGYSLDNNISQAQLNQAYGWIKKSADQGFAPAKAAEKLFVGRVQGAAN